MTKIAPAAAVLLAFLSPSAGQDSGAPATCSFCPAGMTVQFPSAVVDESMGKTCADLDDEFAEISSEFDCSSAKFNLLYNEGYPPQCGYCVPSADADAAALAEELCLPCAGGSVPQLPAGTPANFFIFEFCGEEAYSALSLDGGIDAGTESCDFFQEEFGPLCGCPVEGPTCEICSGDDSFPDEGSFSSFFGIPCSELPARAQFIPENSNLCDSISVSAVFECGCTYVPPEKSFCPLCGDGTSVEDPFQSVGTWPDPFNKCGAIEWFYGINESPEEDDSEAAQKYCAAVQSTYGAACGCVNPPEPACPATCPEGTKFDYSGIAEFSGFDVMSCLDKSFSMSSDDSEECTEENVATLSEACCVAPCSLCPAGSTVQFPEEIYNETTGETCADIENKLAELPGRDDMYSCFIARSNLIYNDFPCGYCVPSADATEIAAEVCTICTDGSVPQLPAETLTSYGLECAKQALEISLYEEVGSESCAVQQAMFGPQCGCALQGEPCTICGGNEVPDTFAYSYSFGAYCADLASVVSFIPEDSELCLKGILAAIFECGCIYTAPEEVACPLCADGTKVEDPFLSLGPDSYGPLDSLKTCGAFEWTYGTNVSSDAECTAVQATIGARCGCADPPELACPSQCPAGTSFDYSSTIEVFRGDFSSYDTCDDRLIELSTNEEECTEENVAALNGACCADKCTLCPNGFTIQFPGNVFNETTGKTCADLDSDLMLVPEGFVCSGMKNDLIYSDFFSTCGYCIPSTDSTDVAKVCTLCEDGSVPQLPAETPTMDYYKCGSRAYELLSNYEAGDESCAFAQSYNGPQCGCPVLDGPTCTVCAGGEIPNKDAFTSTFGTNCSTLSDRAPFIPEDSELCTQLSFVATFECGCEYTPPAEPICPLCADGTNVKDPLIKLDPYDPARTCGALEWIFGTSESTEAECAAIQATAGASCGCIDPPKPACITQCPPGTTFDTSSYVDTGYLFLNCYDARFQLSVDVDQCTAENVTALSEACCSTPCSLCPAGSNIQFPDAIYNETMGKTCADLEAELALFPDHSCGSILYDKFSFGYPQQCGYCIPSDDNSDAVDTCTLCADGSVPQLPANTLTTTGSECGAQAFMISRYDEAGSESCAFIQSFIGSQCGCPLLEGPACKICPGGGEITKPNANSTLLGTTCSDIASRAPFVPADSDLCFEGSMVAVLECGCDYVTPSETTCTLCAGGEQVNDPFLVLAPEDPVYNACGGLEWLLSTLTPSEAEECAAFQATAGAACGCANPPEPACAPQCPAGTKFNFTKKTVSEYSLGEVLCGELLFELSVDKDECTKEAIASVSEKCCVKDLQPVPTCKICEVPNPEVFSSRFNSTCGDIADKTQLLSETSDLCFEGTVASIYDCGCEWTPPAKSSCSLCTDGASVEDHFRLLDPDDPFLACGALEWEASRIPADEQQVCTAIQATAGAACGCSDPPEPACVPQCPAGNTFDLVKKTDNFLHDDTDEKVLCGSVLSEMSVVAEVCNEENMALLSNSCCVAELTGAEIGVPTVAPTGMPTKTPDEDQSGTGAGTDVPTKTPTEEEPDVGSLETSSASSLSMQVIAVWVIVLVSAGNVFA